MDGCGRVSGDPRAQPSIFEFEIDIFLFLLILLPEVSHSSFSPMKELIVMPQTTRKEK
jgi:hypothetical protein